MSFTISATEGDADETLVDDSDTPEERLAAQRAEAPTWAFSIPLALRWSYRQALVVDAEKGLDKGEPEFDKYGHPFVSYSDQQAHGPAHRLVDVIAQGEKALVEWPSFALEVFGILYGRVRDMLPVDPPPTLAAALHMALASRPEWEGLTDACRNRRAIACDTTALVLREVMHEILRLQDLPVDAASAARPAEGDEGGEGDEGDEGDEGGKDPAQLRREALARKAARVTNWQWLEELLTQVLATAAIDDTLREALRGMLSPGGYSPGGDADDVIEGVIDMNLLNQLRGIPHLKELLDLIGRMQRASRVEQTPSTVKTEPEGIKQGDDVNDLLLTEHALYDAAPDVWMRRYLDKETLVTERNGRQEQARGDVVVLVDASGSMHGEPHKWASALAGALMLESLAAGRRCVVGRFSDPHRYRDCAVLSPADVAEGFHILSLVPDGGTAAADALQKASKRLEAPLQEPDIVLITDGGWPDLDEATLRATKGPDGRGRLFVILLEPNRSKESIPGAAGVWSIPQLDMKTASEVLSRVRESDVKTGGDL